MKKTELTRRVGLKRQPIKPGPPLTRRTPLKKISAKRRKRIMELKPMLTAYRKEFPVCQRFGCGKPARELHEIAAGSHRDAARQSRACILHLCPECHDTLQGTAYERQLAHKLVADPEGFDLVEFNGVLRREAVCFADVTAFLGVLA